MFFEAILFTFCLQTNHFFFFHFFISFIGIKGPTRSKNKSLFHELSQSIELRKLSITMGWFGSSEEIDNAKTVDSNGNVNNNIIIQEARDVHSQMVNNEKLLVATCLLLCAEILKISFYVFHAVRRSIKKRYQKN